MSRTNWLMTLIVFLLSFVWRCRMVDSAVIQLRCTVRVRPCSLLGFLVAISLARVQKS